MKSDLEQIYGPRHRAKDLAGGGSSSFQEERGRVFVDWVGTGKKILDLGCRDGRISRYLLKAGNQVTGFDIDSGALKLCPPEMKTEQHDLNSDWHIDHKGEFDVVLATEVVEHLYYPEKVLEKISYVLKPGGMFIGSVPNAFNIKNRIRLFFARPQNTPLGEPTHINHFSYQILNTLLSKHLDQVFVGAIGKKNLSHFLKIWPGLTGFLLVFKANKR